MKNLLRGLVLICVISVISCKKPGGHVSKNINLVQHKWNVVIEYGEALQYVGTADDYYNFTISNILYTYVNKRHDTSAYSLLSDDHTLVLYPVVNGVKSATATNFNIDSISASALTISSYITNPPGHFQVFLSR
jgi:hypothetical protein